MSPDSTTVSPGVELRAVGKVFGGNAKSPSVAALNSTSLFFEAGKFVSVVGPSGCGKTTMARMIAGLEEPSQGCVLIDGRPSEGPNPKAAMVFQAASLLPWKSVRSNIVLAATLRGIDKQEAGRRAAELMEMAHIADFERSLPHELSGGMQQRVAICRALIVKPSVLLMDEPFGALDAMTRERMGIELMRIWELTRPTVIFITHSIAESVLLSDRVIVMSPRPGRVVDDISIELSRPRTPLMLEEPKALDYMRRIRTHFDMESTHD